MKKEVVETGYPHIDQPWMKYYSEEQRKITVPNMNTVDYLKEKNKNYLSSTAEMYYGRKYSYDELFENYHFAAKALAQVGVKKGDVIANLISNIPEAGQIWHGAVEIGAISDFIDPRPDGMNQEANAKKVLEILKYEKAKFIVSLDFSYLSMLKPIEVELKDMGIDTIILVGADDSMTDEGKLDYLNDIVEYNRLENSRKSKKQQISDYKALSERIKMQEMMQKDLEEAVNSSILRIVKFKDLVRECKNSTYERVSDGDLINYIGHTSGTSGSRPKPITITNKQGISLAEQCEKGGFSPKRGEKSFHLLPFFAPAGAYSNYFVNLSSGAETIDVSEFYIGDFGYLLKKYKPNYLLATPAWLTLLPEYDLLSNEDLSYLYRMIYVGDSATSDDITRLKKWLKEHNSIASVASAHGMSELGGCGSYATGVYNKFGSVGIPLPKTIYSIVDPNVDDRLVPLRFKDGEERLAGELVIACPNMTDGRLGEDKIVPHYEMDGKEYIRTNDLVEMDRDGVFYHNDRKDRSFTRVDGYKVKPFEIERVIVGNQFVKYAVIVPYFDERKNGIMPMCHIVLDEQYSDLLPEDVVHDIVYHTIIENPDMSSRQIPSKFKFRDSLPKTKNAKVDFITLSNEEFDGSEINVSVYETNLTVGNIEIYRDCDNKVLKLK